MSIIPTKSILDYAMYYFNMGINVYPHCQGNTRWDKLKDLEQREGDMEIYEWEAFDGIDAIAGKTGVRMLKFMKIRDMSILNVANIIKDALDILHLPKDYPWVIIEPDAIAIIIKNSEDDLLTRNRSYAGRESLSIGQTILLWEGLFPLPCTNPRIHFLTTFPNGEPAFVKSDYIFKCLDIFREGSIADAKDLMKVLGI